MKKLLGLLGLGAGLRYFFDREQGRARRAQLQSRLGGMFRGRARQVSQLGTSAGEQATGTAQKIQDLQAEVTEPPDDVTLTRKVETEIFRDDSVPKGQINVNAENGKIVLRGEVGQPEMISDLEQRARSVQGVEDVENLLHLPGAEAPMHQ